MTVQSADPDQPWTDYTVRARSPARLIASPCADAQPGESYCSCPDFRTNTLGTCKHILHVLAKLKRRFTAAQLKQPYKRRTISVHVQYGDTAALRLLLPDKLDPESCQSPRRVARPRHRRRAGPAQADPDSRAARADNPHLPRCGRIHPAAAPARPHRAPRRRDPPQPGVAPSAPRTAQEPSCCPISSTASRSPPAPAAPFSPTTWAWARRSRPSASPEFLAREAGISQGARRLPGVAEIAVAERNPALLRRATVQLIAGGIASRGAAIRQRLLLHRLQLRAGAARHPVDRTRELGPHHSGRRPAHQELGGEDQPRDQRASVAVRARAVGHAARKPARRAVFGRAVHRRPPARAGVSLLQPPPRRRRKGQGARLQEPGRAAREPPAGAAPPHAPVGAPASCRRGRTKSSASRRPRSNSICTTRTCRSSRRSSRKKFLTEMDLLRLQKHLLMCRMSANSTFLVDKQAPGYSSKLEELDELVRPAVRRRGPQGGALLRMDDDARPDRAASEEAPACLRAPRRFSAAKAAAGAGPRISKRSPLPACFSRRTPARPG